MVEFWPFGNHFFATTWRDVFSFSISLACHSDLKLVPTRVWNQIFVLRHGKFWFAFWLHRMKKSLLFVRNVLFVIGFHYFFVVTIIKQLSGLNYQYIWRGFSYNLIQALNLPDFIQKLSRSKMTLLQFLEINKSFQLVYIFICL